MRGQHDDFLDKPFFEFHVQDLHNKVVSSAFNSRVKTPGAPHLRPPGRAGDNSLADLVQGGRTWLLGSEVGRHLGEGEVCLDVE